MLKERIEAVETQPSVGERGLHETNARTLPFTTVRDTIEKQPFWSYLTQVVEDLTRKSLSELKNRA